MDEHVTHLRTVFEKLCGNKVYVKQKKCTFAVTHIGHLRYIAGNSEVRVDQDKVSAISEWPDPESVKHVQ